MTLFFKCAPSILLLAVVGCVSLPNGPSVMVLPGTSVSFEQFRNDNEICRQFASAQIGGVSPNQAYENSGVASAAVGTALGAAAGAAFSGGEGAAVGAASGLLAGSAMGTGAAASSGYAAQQNYDAAYIQCMYAKGNRVPVYGDISNTYPGPPPAPPQNIPPPPPGPPPPPPPY